MALSKPPLLPVFFFALAAGSWLFWEMHAHAAFDCGSPTYDWLIESLSDLGVDYRQVHPLKHHNVTSFRHGAQNFNFMQAGVCFGLGQLLLLFLTRKRVTGDVSTLRTLRFLFALLYAASMVLVGNIHGGPREKHWGIIGWHWMGFGMAAVAGNLNSIVAAATPTTGPFEGNVMYRGLSAAFGVAGLYSFWRFQTLGEWDYQTQLGLWQRGMIYPVLAWEALTAVALVLSNVAGGSEVGKGKRA